MISVKKAALHRTARAVAQLRNLLPANCRCLVLCLVLLLLPGTTAADPQDEHRLAAQRTFAEGEHLRAQGTAESLRKAKEKYAEALRLWHATGDRGRETATLVRLGGVYAALGERQKALEFYRRGLARWKLLPPTPLPSPPVKSGPGGSVWTKQWRLRLPTPLPTPSKKTEEHNPFPLPKDRLALR